jgi:hypothetical protein
MRDRKREESQRERENVRVLREKSNLLDTHVLKQRGGGEGGEGSTSKLESHGWRHRCILWAGLAGFGSKIAHLTFCFFASYSLTAP